MYRKGTIILLTVVSWLILVVSGILLLYSIDEDPDTFVATGVLCAIGLCVNGFAWYLRNKARLNNRYIDLIINQQIPRLSAVAKQTGVKKESLISDLNKLMQKGYLPGVKIIDTQDLIILPGAVDGEPIIREPYKTTCEGCGAAGVVTPGEISFCKYCGSPLG